MRGNDQLDNEPVDPRIRRTRALIHEASGSQRVDLADHAIDGRADAAELDLVAKYICC